MYVNGVDILKFYTTNKKTLHPVAVTIFFCVPMYLFFSFISFFISYIDMPNSLMAISFPTQQIGRVHISSFQPNIHYFHATHETPIIVENYLPRTECELISESIVRAAYNIPVQIQRQRRNSKASKVVNRVYEAVFGEAIDWMMESRHGDATFSFCEGLLDRCNNQSSIVNDTILQQLAIAKDLFDESDKDLFPFFPKEIRPTDCIILAGEGASSTLHRDPFEWTGTSLCLEGTKLWRFIAPPMVGTTLDYSGVGYVDRAMQSYRLSSVAWGAEDPHNPKPISSGWQSNLSLYASINGKVLPSALQLAQMEEGNQIKQKNDLIQQIVENFDLLTPNIPEVLAHDIQSDSNVSNQGSFKTVIWTAVQNPGDLLLIPAYWWHQTYALEPSLAVASQRCGLYRDAPRVLNHIFETRGLDLNTFMHEYDICSHDDFNQRLKQDPSNLCRKIFSFILKNP